MMPSVPTTMASTIAPPDTAWTLADLFQRLGPMPLRRIRFVPAPGTATEEDVIRIHDREDRLCELIDGVLLEKTMGFFESHLAMLLGHILQRFLDEHDLGIVAGADGMVRLAPGQVRIPDVSFISWSKFPGRRFPREPAPDLAPDLAVEILSPSNTRQEMERKRHDYFAAGVRLVWYVDPEQRTFEVFTAQGARASLGPEMTLDGGEVLPGFVLSLQEFWDRAGKPQS